MDFKYKKRMMLNMAKVHGVQKKIYFTREEVEGQEGEKVEYLLQHPGVRKGLEIQNAFFDSDSGKVNINLKNEAMMKNVIFKSDMTRTNWDYWEKVGMEEAEYVFKEASSFLSGKDSE